MLIDIKTAIFRWSHDHHISLKFLFFCLVLIVKTQKKLMIGVMEGSKNPIKKQQSISSLALC
jgi:hypothetical protein